jgi:glutathione S-transferase
MKLYYTPGACSLAAHIVLHEIGASFEAETVDLGTKRTGSGEDFSEINPKGYVPALRLDDGEVFTEGAALLQYLADQAPEAGLAPPNGSIERYRLIEWLTFVSTEVHKGFGPLWNPSAPDATKEAARATLAKRFGYLDQHLAARAFLTGDRFTIADAYLFTVVNWVNFHAIDLSPYPNLQAFQERVAARPKVQQALRAEGLLKQAA